MDSKQKKTYSGHSSGKHRLNLEAALRQSTTRELELAKERFGEERDVSPSVIPEDFGPVVQEVEEATVRLTESVDKICEALVLVFGKISSVSDESHGQTLALRSLIRWVIGVATVQAVVCLFMIFVMIQTSGTVRTLEDVVVRIAGLTESAKNTERTVAKVKEATVEKSTVELAPDPSRPGVAIVRIVPPKRDVSEPVPSDSRLSPTSAPSVEIPLKVEEARSF